jgi:hypothetical protein
LSNIAWAGAAAVTSSIVYPGQGPVPPGSEPHLTEAFARLSHDHFPLTIEDFVPAGNSFMEHVVFSVDPRSPAANADAVTSSVVYLVGSGPPGSEPHLTETFTGFRTTISADDRRFRTGGQRFMEHVVFNVDPQSPAAVLTASSASCTLVRVGPGRIRAAPDRCICGDFDRPFSMTIEFRTGRQQLRGARSV